MNILSLIPCHMGLGHFPWKAGTMGSDCLRRGDKFLSFWVDRKECHRVINSLRRSKYGEEMFFSPTVLFIFLFCFVFPIPVINVGTTENFFSRNCVYKFRSLFIQVHQLILKCLVISIRKNSKADQY